MRTAILLFILLMYGGANWYTAARVFRMLKLCGSSISAPVFAAAFSVLSITVLLSFLQGRYMLHKAVSAVSSVWMGVLMYLLLYTAAADIIMLLLKLAGLSSDAVKTAAEAAVLVLTAITVVYGAVHAADVQTARYSVDSGRAAEPMKIVLISDIHIGALGTEEHLQKLSDTINAEAPDIVCIAGDIFNNDFSSVKDPEAAAKALGSIKAKNGVYACLGNHDCGNGFEDMLKLVSASGITLLREECAVIDGRCVIYGRADGSPIGTAGAVKRQEINSFTVPGYEELPVIVLDHNPSHISEYGSDVSLVLCGHTHKGQLFPGSLITGSMYTVDYGMYKADESSPAVIVTSGAGYWGPPLRVGTDSEIAVINFKPETNE